jgi:protein-tyrosine phosphatase
MTTPKSNSRHDAGRPVRVLFICLGNYCRSPMAHAVFRHQVAQAGLSGRIEVDSAGLGPWHVGQPAHRGTLEMLRRNDIAHREVGRQIEQAELASFDYVLGMDKENVAALRRLAGSADAPVSLFLPWARERGMVDVDEVPDPYYAGGFDRVYELVERGSQALLDHLRAEHQL